MKTILIKVFIFVKSLWKSFLLKLYIRFAREVKIVIGAGNIVEKNWFTTEQFFLDVTNEKHFIKFFSKRKIDKIFAEHVLEHLNEDQLDLMLNNFSKYCSQKINIRIAVPDGYHKDKSYIDIIKPGGTGYGSEDHKMLFNYKNLSAIFKKSGFIPQLIEYWDENGIFHPGYKDDDKGIVRRSFINDLRNSNGKPNYTSLIVDFSKR
jgi:predicted SAM-dependent methyltransferase